VGFFLRKITHKGAYPVDIQHLTIMFKASP